MAKLQNKFNIGVINKDSDERITANGTLIDAENFLVTTSEGSSSGVGKPALGNVKITNFNIAGAKTIGKGVDSTNEKVYNFVCGDTDDYVIETDLNTNTSAIVLKYTTNGVLNFRKNRRITNVDVIIDPEGNGNLLAFSGDHNPPRIVNIERAKTYTANGFSEQEISVIKAPPTYPVDLQPKYSTENIQANYLVDKFVSFAYRYKFQDGYYSALSSWSEYSFTPGIYNIDFETFENLGMQNQYNAVDVTFNTGPRDVVAIELVFKKSNEFTPFIIDKYIKEDEGWSDNQDVTIEFNNSKTYKVLSEDQFYRSYDNVPLESVAQTIIGNRIAYANYLENRDLIDENGDKVILDYTLSLVANDISSFSLDTNSTPKIYNYGGIPFVSPNGAINIDFTDIELKLGTSINIGFKLLSNVQNLVFTNTFIYVLTDDYTDLSDFLANSDFENQLTVVYMAYFLENGGISFPLNYVPDYVIEQPFGVTVSGVTMQIIFPVISYEIDNSPSPNTFIYDYFYNNNSTTTFKNVSVATSMKSNRGYEICMIYRDEQVRKTTALVSKTNTLFIPNENCITQNQIKVTIPSTQHPPVWAKTYKFGIKFNKQNYETIPINIFYEDGLYRWIKIDGENVNKFAKGDLLIVKKDANGPLTTPVKVKVLELKEQALNFLEPTSLVPVNFAGLYAKIKATNFEMQYGVNEFTSYGQIHGTTSGKPLCFLGDFSTIDETGTVIDKPIEQGTVFRLYLSSNYHNQEPFIIFDKTYVAQIPYDNFEDFYNAQILPGGFVSTNTPDKTYNVVLGRGIPQYGNPSDPNDVTGLTDDPLGRLWIVAEGTESGAGSRRGFLTASMYIRYVSGLYIFETVPKEAKNEIYYETPEVYTITAGEHEMEDHILTKTFNCYCQGNGAESFQIRDGFNEKELAIDFVPTAVSEDEYKQIRRFKDITYSEIFNSNTNVNGLNEFNLSLANYKEDIESNYGPIYKLKGLDTNLDVYQEDKDSIVYYGKDLLFNADGTTNLSRIKEVLGQQKTYEGEYGISIHPDSFDRYAFNSYHTDVKRGVVIKKSNNGLFEISSQGLRAYFKTLFRNNVINHINGKYDQYNDFYVLNIQYNDDQFATWVYSDKDNGWLGRLNFNPEDMVRVNNHFVSFKNGEIYLHNQTSNYNTFYGVQSDSEFSFNFNESPSNRKSHKTIEIEGTIAPEVTLLTDLSNGYINSVDFQKKENVFYAYVRNSNNVIDTALINSCQGIGNCTITGLTLDFGFELENVNIGDEIRNISLQLVGIVQSKTANSLILDTVNNISSGDFVLCSKPQSIEVNDLVGYYMKVTCRFSTNTYQEIFAVNTTISKSFV